MMDEIRDVGDDRETAAAQFAIRRLTSEVVALDQLIAVHERTSLEQATRLEAALRDREDLLEREREARAHAEAANARLEEQATELQAQSEELTANNDELHVLNERIALSLGEVFDAERLLLAFGLHLLDRGLDGRFDLRGQGVDVVAAGAESGFLDELLDLAGNDEGFGHGNSPYAAPHGA